MSRYEGVNPPGEGEQEKPVPYREVFERLIIDMKLVSHWLENPPFGGEADHVRSIFTLAGYLPHTEDLDPSDFRYKLREEIDEIGRKLAGGQYVETGELRVLVQHYCPEAEIPPNPTAKYLLGVLKKKLADRASDIAEANSQVFFAAKRVLEASGIMNQRVSTLRKLAQQLAKADLLEREANTITAVAPGERLRSLAFEIVMILVSNARDTRLRKSSDPDVVRQSRLMDAFPRSGDNQQFDEDIEIVADMFLAECKAHKV